MNTADKRREETTFGLRVEQLRKYVVNGLLPNIAALQRDAAALLAEFGPGGRYDVASASDDDEAALWEEFAAEAADFVMLMQAQVDASNVATVADLLELFVATAYMLDAQTGALALRPLPGEEGA